MPSRFYVAKRSRIGATPVPIVGMKEFEGKCLRSVHQYLTQGEDWSHFGTRQEAIDWVAENEFAEDTRIVSPPEKDLIPKPVYLQLCVGFLVIVAVVVAFTILQDWYYNYCFCGWRIWETGYNLLLSPTCRFYQTMLVEINTWFIQVVMAFFSSFAIFLYPLFMSAWRSWTPFDDKFIKF